MPIRLATEHDNEQLIELARQCPIHAGIDLYIDRSPDFFKIYKLLDKDRFHIFVGEEEGRIVACLGSLYEDYLLNGERATVVSYGDLKVMKEFRMGRISHKISLTDVEKSRERATWGMAYFAEGNKASIGFSEGRGKLPKGIPLCNSVHNSVVPFTRLRTSGGFDIRRATDDDLPAMLELFAHHYDHYGFAPVMTEALLRQILAYPGMSISRFLLASKGGVLEACCATWDQYEFQRFVVLEFDTKSSLIMLAIRMLRPFLKMPASPKVGEHLKFQHLCYVAVRDRQVAPLRDLVRTVLNEMRGGQYSFLNVYFDEKDELKECLKGTVSSTTRALFFAFPLTADFDYGSFSLKKPLVHVEYATFV